MFEKASRIKLRFNTPVGTLSVEDLWDLPLVSDKKFSLDKLTTELHQTLESSPKISFVNPESKEDSLDRLKFDIALHIIKARMAENSARSMAAEKAAQKQKIMDIMSRKQDAALEMASLEELSEMLNKL